MFAPISRKPVNRGFYKFACTFIMINRSYLQIFRKIVLAVLLKHKEIFFHYLRFFLPHNCAAQIARKPVNRGFYKFACTFIMTNRSCLQIFRKIVLAVLLKHKEIFLKHFAPCSPRFLENRSIEVSINLHVPLL